MNPDILAALGALVCYGLADLVYKRAAAAGVEAHHFVMMQAWVFAPAITLYGLINGRLILVPAMLWGSLAGLFMLAAFYSFARSLKDGAVSTNAAIFRLSFAVTAALAVAWFGEPVTVAKAAGMALALLAVWLLLAGGEGAAQSVQSPRAFARILIATLALGIGNFIYKVGLAAGATPETMLVGQAAVFCSLATVSVALVERRLAPPRHGWPYAGAAAATLLLALLLLLHGLVHSDASLLVPVAQMGFVVTAILGIVFLGEALTWRKAVGLAVAVAALACFASA
jgi:drug/metabolite transporter (DMT)-like permease